MFIHLCLSICFYPFVFVHLCLSICFVSSETFRLRLVILYRPPYSHNHPVTTNSFFADLSKYLESVILSTEPLVITGDFNIHVDDIDDPDTERLLELLESIGLHQHVDQLTHELGHTLDLIITRQSNAIAYGSPVPDRLFSDHLSVMSTLKAAKTRITTKEHLQKK